MRTAARRGRRAAGPLGTALAAAAFLLPAAGGSPHRQLVRFNLDSAATRVWFTADATLGSFDGRAGRVVGWADVSSLATFAAVGRVDIDVASFRTGNGIRDGHLRGELSADAHPWLTFELRRVRREGAAQPVLDAGLEPVGGTPVLLDGALTVRGRSTPVEVPAVVGLRGDTLRVVGRLDTRFTALGMDPPSRLLGTARVRDPIMLMFDATFLREAPR